VKTQAALNTLSIHGKVSNRSQHIVLNQHLNSQASTLWASQRLKAAVATPLLFLSALSNGYFLAGYEVGNIFVLRSIESENFA
jgi:hypothetical protein